MLAYLLQLSTLLQVSFVLLLTANIIMHKIAQLHIYRRRHHRHQYNKRKNERAQLHIYRRHHHRHRYNKRKNERA